MFKKSKTAVNNNISASKICTAKTPEKAKNKMARRRPGYLKEISARHDIIINLETADPRYINTKI